MDVNIFHMLNQLSSDSEQKLRKIAYDTKK